MIAEGLASGALRPGRRILDATSGNTGIAYAMIGASLGFPVTLCLPANASPERKRILHAYGVELILTDPLESTDGAIRKARELYAASPGRYFYPDQYNNDANWRAHYLTTGPELIEQTDGRLTHFVAGLGTSGTFTGVGRRLREFRSDVRLISVQPDSPMHGIEGLKHMPTAIVPGIYDPSLADEDRSIATERAFATVRRLARSEGLLVGISSGAALAVAVDVAREIDRGVVVTIFPDGADKYLSETFWGENA
jgi:cysteine synthase B